MLNHFARNLKKLREIENKSQQDVADAINVSQRSVSHWESGLVEPGLNKLIELSRFFDISIDDLVIGDY